MKEYSIHGGNPGAERLEILASTLASSTEQFLKSTGSIDGMKCLNLGCGIGRVSFQIAKMIGSHGTITGLDIEDRNIQIAKTLAETEQLNNTTFNCFDVYNLQEQNKYDLIYSRFLLSHLADAKVVLQIIFNAAKPGGKILIEDTDFSGHFCNPPSTYFDQYVVLYQELLHKRGANANLGQQLVTLLKEVGFTQISFHISQIAHTHEEGKLMAEITFEGISDSLIEEGLLTPKEASKIHSELMKFRKQEDSIISLPRIFQVSAIRPI